MKVIHIVASIDDEAAGPSLTVPRLAQAQARAGLQTEIFTVGGTGPMKCVVPATRFEHSLSGVPVLSRLRLSSNLHDALRTRAHDADILHTHGLWLMPNIYPAWAVQGRRARFVLSPRGMLSEEALGFSSLRKRVIWATMQRRAVHQAALFHATCDQEVAEIRAQGLNTPAVVAPNGIDVPTVAADKSSRAGPRTVLALGRIHPKKGLDRLIKAWVAVESDAPDWRLRIVGPDELGYAETLRDLIVKLGIRRAVIEGPLFGEPKLTAYREASLFVLASLNENFAMTVAEALAVGTPVISTKGAPWERLVQEGCGWWIDHGEEPLASTLREVFSMPKDGLAEMGLRGRAWMQRDFAWDAAARKVTAAYEWLTLGVEPQTENRVDPEAELARRAAGIV